jgi:hypothetical protein
MLWNDAFRLTCLLFSNNTSVTAVLKYKWKLPAQLINVNNILVTFHTLEQWFNLYAHLLQ